MAKGSWGQRRLPELHSGKLESDPLMPCCGRIGNGYIAVDGTADAPKPGDYSICLYCGTVLGYSLDAEGKLSLARLNEIEDTLARADRSRHPSTRCGCGAPARTPSISQNLGNDKSMLYPTWVKISGYNALKSLDSGETANPRTPVRFRVRPPLTL